MTFESKYGLGDRVRLVHDPAKEDRLVVQVSFGGTGVRYNLMCGTQDTWHYEREIIAPDETSTTVVKGFTPNS